jgi:hypothetical protein
MNRNSSTSSSGPQELNHVSDGDVCFVDGGFEFAACFVGMALVLREAVGQGPRELLV